MSEDYPSTIITLTGLGECRFPPRKCFKYALAFRLSSSLGGGPQWISGSRRSSRAFTRY